MQRLIESGHRFRQELFGQGRPLFREFSRQAQSPDTLFITCESGEASL